MSTRRRNSGTPELNEWRKYCMHRPSHSNPRRMYYLSIALSKSQCYNHRPTLQYVHSRRETERDCNVFGYSQNWKLWIFLHWASLGIEIKIVLHYLLTYIITTRSRSRKYRFRRWRQVTSVQYITRQKHAVCFISCLSVCFLFCALSAFIVFMVVVIA